MEKTRQTGGVISPKYGGGPHGIGDPDDKTLRKVEKNILIPQIVRDRTRAEKCIPEVEEFTNCCKDNKYSMIFKCREENNKLQKCLQQWYHDKDFQEECKQLYIQQRSEYRRTNLSKKLKEDKTDK